MRARAPGKVVISGAYAVLWGAPAIVAAVNRYVLADSARNADLLTPEVRAALGTRAAPWFDASALRENDRKLGLGSSAAILVASLAALELAQRGPLDDARLCAAVFGPAWSAHREAQPGGSGIDVAASAHGGTLLTRRRASGLEVVRAALPSGLQWEVWATGTPASTPELVQRVRLLQARDPHALDAQAEASEAAARALLDGDAHQLLRALAAQSECLRRLGEAADAGIVTSAMDELHSHAHREHAVVLPSGAGGGDVVLFAGPTSPSPSLRALVDRCGYRRLAGLELEARGVHAA